jgi:hypothetical protein
LTIIIPSRLYFGQPLAGFFFSSDFLTASCQFPCSFKRYAFGPGVAFFLEWFELFTAFFLLTILNILPLRKWVFVHQTLAFGGSDRCNRALISPRLASEAGPNVSPMARQLLDTMVPVIPTGR